jgi:trehalose-6-phosphate synthase
MAQATHPPSLKSVPFEAASSEIDFCLPALNVISYRGPGQKGSLSGSLEPIVKRLNTKVSWFALTGLPRSATRLSRFTFHTPSAAQVVFDQHAQFCTGYLNPLFHGMPERAKFDPVAWKSFKQLNELMASDALNMASQSFPTLFWLHDYELSLVAPIISVQAGVIPCHFWHSPWPSSSALLTSPIASELVEAMLTNTLIGFQTSEYATNFLTTVQELLPKAQVDVLKMTIKLGRTTTRVVVMPFGIDGKYWQDQAKHSRPLAHVLAKKYNGSGHLVLGIDRLDASKGIVQKLDGLAEFLKSNPSWRKRFQYVQLTHANEHEVLANNDYLKELTEKIASVNALHAVGAWQPIIHLKSNLDKAELSAWYQAANILAVNSVVEALSLVAKEYIACRADDQGVLMLSRGSGSVSELGQGAVLIDPASKESFAAGLLQAFSMTKEERRHRMELMKRVVSWNNLQDWAIRFLREALV